jgi:hypothetical protein
MYSDLLRMAVITLKYSLLNQLWKKNYDFQGVVRAGPVSSRNLFVQPRKSPASAHYFPRSLATSGPLVSRVCSVYVLILYSANTKIDTVAPFRKILKLLRTCKF